MNIRGSKQISIGLPATGKTTFLAALWHIVDSGDVPGSLQLAHTHGDQGYLNRIAAKWGNGQKLSRTSPAEETVVAMRLVADDGAITEVYFPDLDGESFTDQWVHRKCRRSYFEQADGASGILLFVHPDTVREPLWIEQRNALAAAARADGTGNEAAVSGTTDEDLGKSKPWDARVAPTQVQLVELLQFLTQLPFHRRPRRVAVIISAWDTVQSVYDDPPRWLRERLPLLEQFLVANRELFPARVYGISAQGGELGNRDLLQIPASQRIIVAGPEARPHDITAPIRWLMEKDATVEPHA